MAEGARFKSETVHKLLQIHFNDKKTKIHADALKLSNELLTVFVKEGSTRAALRAKSEGVETVTIEHFEKILPQLLLDF